MIDSETKLRERQQEIIKILESIDEVLKTKAWQTLKTVVFDNLVGRVERLLLSEAEAQEPNMAVIYRLQGELSWARRYADLKSYAEKLEKELKGIKDKLQ